LTLSVTSVLTGAVARSRPALRAPVGTEGCRAAIGITHLTGIRGVDRSRGDAYVANLASLALTLIGRFAADTVGATVLVASGHALSALTLITDRAEGPVITAGAIAGDPLLAIAIAIAAVRLVAST